MHESQIIQAELEDGAARDQKHKYVMYIAQKQIKAPNAKSQDPYEVSLVQRKDVPWTQSRDAFMKHWQENPQEVAFLVAAWAHQHLYESRKIVANHFKGTQVESSFRHHQLIIWVGLTFDEQSRLSSVNNAAAHDVREVDVPERMHKLRYNWTRLGCFDWERSNSQKVKKMKSACFESLGITTKQGENTMHTTWKLATAPEFFFNKVIDLCEAHQEGKIKNQKLNKTAMKALAKKAKKGNAGMAEPVDWTQKYKDTLKGVALPFAILSDLSWVSKPNDHKNIGRFLDSVLDGSWNLQEYSYNLNRYKTLKYLRLQLKTEVRFIFSNPFETF